MTSLPSHPGRAWSGERMPPPCLDAAFRGGDSGALRRWLSARPVRVMILLLAVWMLNGFDLLFTILADKLGCFIELNPLAASLLGDGNYGSIILYKLVLVGAGTYILWQLRHHRLAEMSCWLVTIMYSVLALRWYRFYESWNHYAFHGDRVYYYLPAGPH